jgi:hypothetical protein
MTRASDAWPSRAGELAAWAFARLVNRTDVWGGYNAVVDRDKIVTRANGTAGPLGATTTRPAKSKRGKVVLTPALLERHFRARGPLDVVGLHTTAPDNTSKWGTVELDHHGPASNPAEVNFRAARAWSERLRGLGFRPLLWDSNGQGGFHLDVLLAGPVSTPRLYHFLRRLVSDHAAHGLGKPPETFPKQPRIGPSRFGNWGRLIGRHHTSDFWAKVWDGGRWLDGAPAVEFVLTLDPSPASLPSEAPPPPRPPGRVFVPAAGGGDLSARIAAYAARLPNLAEGEGRDAVAFHFAAWFARDLQLPDPISLDWLCRWDDRNRPPKGRPALAEILANAHAYGTSPYGCGLGALPRLGGRHRAVTITHTAEI